MQPTVIPPGPCTIRWGSTAPPPPLSGHHSHRLPRPNRLSPTSVTTPCALEQLVKNTNHDIKRWHGGGYSEDALDGLDKLFEDNLQSLEVVKPSYDAVLESHEQLISTTLHANFDKAFSTRVALKHPVWDNLTDNSPEGWMEFYKSLCRNAMTFAIAFGPV
jgi:hypothetical protein